MLTVFSKILETVVARALRDFFSKYNLLSGTQHGYVEGRSTETATIDFIDYVNEQLDRGKMVAGVFFDLSKAFDSVDKGFVGQKLCAMGVRGVVLKLITSFLEERKMYVNLGGCCSEQCDVGLGVAQGSVIGPLVFLAYVNDLSSFVRSGHLVTFADDTNVIVSARSNDKLDGRVRDVCAEINDWCQKNNLLLNQTKTVTVQFYR